MPGTGDSSAEILSRSGVRRREVRSRNSSPAQSACIFVFPSSNACARKESQVRLKRDRDRYANSGQAPCCVTLPTFRDVAGRGIGGRLRRGGRVARGGEKQNRRWPAASRSTDRRG